MSQPADTLPTKRDSIVDSLLARLTVRVTRDSASGELVGGAVLRSGPTRAQTDVTGTGILRLVPGLHQIVVGRLGFSPDTLAVTLRPGQDTTVTAVLRGLGGALDAMVVSATRSNRRIEDDPVRVEVIDEEEVGEKVMMTPGDVTMMLNETSGLRVQTTSPSLGGANVRIQGLRGRYTQMLTDGLPLYGGQTGGLGLLQIPPMDLGGVEVIKGVASALYGGSALGGVVNLTSRRPPAPGERPVREVMVNQTSQGGSDLIGFAAAPLGDHWGYTVLAGGHRQRQTDRDTDGWTDIPGYERAVVRPRLFWTSATGHSAMLTAGMTLEARDGGSMPGHDAPDGVPFRERLRTGRYDAGGVARVLVGRNVLSLRGAAAGQGHRHTFGAVVERDRHLTWFGEAALTAERGKAVYVAGTALQQERYRTRDVAGMDYTFTVPGLFAQATVEPARWLALTASGRVDHHSEYGTQAAPRLSALVRVGPAWTVRASGGGGYFAPSPFVEETEVTGLTPLLPLRGAGRSLGVERGRSASLDVGGLLATPVGAVEVNATAFGAVVADPVAVRAAPDQPGRIELVNAAGPARTAGGELLARWTPEPFRVTATYAHVRATELDPETGARRPVPLTPRHQAGVVASWEAEHRGRIGLELYYTGRQALDDDPFRATSRPYVLVGMLAERHLRTRAGTARVFVNFENVTDVRQTRFAPLVRRTPGLGGRWTTDVWAPLEGRVVNAGVRWEIGARPAADHDEP